LPGAFNKSSPANGATKQSVNPTLTWGSSSKATSYQYCYDTTNDNACAAWISNGTSTNVSLSGLSPNTTYYWQVRAVNSNGTAYANGSNTAFWSFKTMSLPAAFNKSSPTNNSLKQPTNPILTWSASIGATSYQYCYDTTNDNTCASWISNGSSTSASLSGLLSNTTYYWQVRAVNLGGTTYANTGTWWNFKVVLAPPTLTSPSNGAAHVGTRPHFNWSDPNTSGVTGYTIEISKNNTFTSLVVTGNVTTNTYTPSANLPTGTLYWRVEVNGSNGPSPWSTYFSFSTS